MSKRSSGSKAVPTDQPSLLQTLESTGLSDCPSSELHRRECHASPVHSEANGLNGHTQFLGSCDDDPSVRKGGPRRGEHIFLLNSPAQPQTWQELRGGTSTHLLGTTCGLWSSFLSSLICHLLYRLRIIIISLFSVCSTFSATRGLATVGQRGYLSHLWRPVIGRTLRIPLWNGE